MKNSLFVCLFVVLIVSATLEFAAQTPALQPGVSVQMVSTRNAVTMPAADEEDAWVITVTADGKLFFGIEPMSPSGLVEAMRVRPRKRWARLYTKADARAPFTAVAQALNAAEEAGFESAVFLTSQRLSAPNGGIVPPFGLEIHLRPVDVSHAVSVEVDENENHAPVVRLNGSDISAATFASSLGQRLQAQPVRIVDVTVRGSVPFAEASHVVDQCAAAGAQVYIRQPNL
jgi:biopolymer transport protein ExbD